MLRSTIVLLSLLALDPGAARALHVRVQVLRVEVPAASAPVAGSGGFKIFGRPCPPRVWSRRPRVTLRIAARLVLERSGVAPIEARARPAGVGAARRFTGVRTPPFELASLESLELHIFDGTLFVDQLPIAAAAITKAAGTIVMRTTSGSLVTLRILHLERSR